MNNISRIKRIKARVPQLTFPINLDLGCFDNKHRQAGFIGLDINDYGQEILWDAEQGLPLPDQSCIEIRAFDFFEHVEDFVGIMNECHRVLTVNGILHMRVPNKDHRTAFIPSHIRRFDKYTFDFFQYPAYANEYGSSLWKVLLLDNDNEILNVKLQPIK